MRISATFKTKNLRKNDTTIIIYLYQKKWPQVHDMGAYSMFVARTALGQPGAGHHFKLG